MKKYLSFIKIAALVLVCWINIFPQSGTPFSINEAPIPNNGQPVNDFANVIDDATEAALNQKIKDFKARTDPPVVLAVATIRTTGDRPMEDYALALARGWKIGADTDDNPAALLIIAIDDKKYRTEISRNLEDELPDALAGQLQRQFLVPAVRQQDYAKGINDTIDAYIRTIEARTSGTVTSPTPPNQQTPRERLRRSPSLFSGGACCLIILVILIIIILSRGGRGGRGGGFGGGGGGILPWIIGSAIANSLDNSRGSSWGGGGSSWGGSGGGGGDWGGFGGGGDFGGGGAGGDW